MHTAFFPQKLPERRVPFVGFFCVVAGIFTFKHDSFWFRVVFPPTAFSFLRFFTPDPFLLTAEWLRVSVRLFDQRFIRRLVLLSFPPFVAGVFLYVEDLRSCGPLFPGDQ